MNKRRSAYLLILLFVSVSVQAAGPDGRWVGTWSSDSTGHQGPLNARIRRVDSDTYRAVFAGRFAKVIPFVYPAKLERLPGSYHCYQSNTRLPLLGDYRMTASINNGKFNAIYRSKSDRGVFRMTQR